MLQSLNICNKKIGCYSKGAVVKSKVENQVGMQTFFRVHNRYSANSWAHSAFTNPQFS